MKAVFGVVNGKYVLLRRFFLDIFGNQEAAGLPGPKFGVDAIFLFKQLGVGTFFNDFALVHDHEPVHGGDG